MLNNSASARRGAVRGPVSGDDRAARARIGAQKREGARAAAGHVPRLSHCRCQAGKPEEGRHSWARQEGIEGRGEGAGEREHAVRVYKKCKRKSKEQVP